MKLTSTVCKEIISMDLNDKTIASFQPDVSPGHYNFKLQANEINFENFSAQQYFKNPYRNPFQSSSLLAIRTFFRICCVIEMFLRCFKRLVLFLTEFYGHLPCLNLAKIRDTADKAQGVSLIYKTNKAGPRREPCGTPELTDSHPEPRLAQFADQMSM